MSKKLARNQLDDIFIIPNLDIAEKYETHYCNIVSDMCFDGGIQRFLEDSIFEYVKGIQFK